MTILRDEKRKARKDHKCCLCCGTIKKGELYGYNVVKDDNISDFKYHIHCEFLIYKLDMCRADDELSEDVFYDYVSDAFDDEFSIADKAKLLYEKFKGDQKCQ